MMANNNKGRTKGGKVAYSNLFPFAPIEKDFQLPSIASVGFDPPSDGPAPEVLGNPAESPRTFRSRPPQKFPTNKVNQEASHSPDRSQDALQRSSPSHSFNYGSNRSTPQRLLPIGNHPPAITNIMHVNAETVDADVNHVNENQKPALKPKKRKQSKPVVASHRTSISLGGRAESKKIPKLDDIPKQKQVLPKISSYEQLILGNLENLPPQRSSIVRIFLSSTFSDFKTERNALVKYAYPEMKQFCADLCLDFQVVDLRWGISEEATNDHSVEKLCLLEVEHCKRLSRGTNFVALMGDRYGFRPIPPEVEATEFELLRGIADDLKLEGRVTMDTWYKRDDNADPPVYILQSIDSRLHHFRDSDPENRDLRIADSAKWNTVSRYLATTLRQCATEAVKRKLITSQREHEYYYSVTEQEITEGILKAPDRNATCLVFIRSFTGIESDVNQPETDAKRYIDITKDLSGSDVIDPECETLREQVKHEILPKKLQSSNIKEFKVPWKPKGVNPADYKEHKEYIRKLSESFCSELKKQIRAISDKENQEIKKEFSTANILYNPTKNTKCPQKKKPKNVPVKGKGQAMFGFGNDPRMAASLMKGQIAINEMIKGLKVAEETSSDDDGIDHSRIRLNTEILHHLHLCLDKCRVFCGRQKELALVEQFVKHSHHRQPLVVYGNSGSGKTAFCAIVTKKIRMWLGEQSVVIVRFLGTSARSSTLRLMLDSICQQICVAYKIIPDKKKLTNGNKVAKYLQELLLHVSVMFGSSVPLVLILDSLDQLSPTDGAHKLSWLPQDIPSGVHFIISLKEEAIDLLDKIRTLFPDKKSCFVQLSQMSENVILEYIGAYSSAVNRTFTENQHEYLVKHLSKHPHPLLMKISMDEACRWHSYTDAADLRLPDCVRDAVAALFERYEQKFGKVFIEAALGYITASRDGLSYTELEDALSCSDHVLSDVYEYHNPPLDGIVRIPPLLWARAKYDLQDYIVERLAQGKTTLFWYHWQFFEVALKRYCVSDAKTRLHLVLADIFDAEQPIKRTIRLEKRKLTVLDADRQVAPQPLISKNVRKLVVLPYHLLNAHDLERLRTHCWCNLKFLICYIEAFSFGELLAAMSETLAEIKDVSIEIVYSALKFSSMAFTSDLEMLPVQLLGSLLRFAGTLESIQNLCLQCSGLITARSKVTMMPTLGSIPMSSKMLKWYHNGPNDVVAVSNDKSRMVLLHNGEKKAMYQVMKVDTLDLGHFLQDANLLQDEPAIRCLMSTNNEKIYLLYTEYVHVYSAQSGKRLTRFSVDAKQNGFLNHEMAVSPDDEHIVLGGKERLALYEMTESQDTINYRARAAMNLGSTLATSNIIFSHDPNRTISTHTVLGKKSTFGVIVLWNFWEKQLKTRVGLPAPVMPHYLYQLQPLASHDLVICGCNNGHISVIDMDLGQLVIEVSDPVLTPGPRSAILSSFSSTSGVLLTGVKGQKSVQLWNMDLTSSRQITTLTLEDNLAALCLTSDGKTAVIGDSTGTTSLYSGNENPALLKALKTHDDAVTHINCDDLDQVITVSADCTLKLWDLECAEEENSIISLERDNTADSVLLENEQITCCCVSMDGRHIITGSKLKAIIWKRTNATYSFQKSLLDGDITKVALGSSDSVLVVLVSRRLCLLDWAASSREVEISGLADVKEVHDFCVKKNCVTLMTLSQGKSSIFKLDLDRKSLVEQCTVSATIPSESSLVDILEGDKFVALRIAVSDKAKPPVEYHLMSVSTETGHMTSCLSEGPDGKLTKRVFSFCSHGKSSLFLGCHGDVVVWQPGNQYCEVPDSAKKSWLKHFQCIYGIHSDKNAESSDKVRVTSVVSSSDGKVIVTGGEDGSLVLWNNEKGSILKGHSGMITSAALCNNATCLVTGSRDRTIQLWDLTARRRHCIIHVHMNVDSVSFCRDESMIVATASEGDAAKVFAFDVVGEAAKSKFFVTQ